MIRAIVCAFLVAGPVSAQTLCDRLDVLDGDTLILSQGRADCRESLAPGGARSFHCALEFIYRSRDATTAFEELVAEVSACIGPDAIITQDQSVNHPDAYDLRTFAAGARSYAVSIKDKGALQQTLVFVRVQKD